MEQRENWHRRPAVWAVIGVVSVGGAIVGWQHLSPDATQQSGKIAVCTDLSPPFVKATFNSNAPNYQPQTNPDNLERLAERDASADHAGAYLLGLGEIACKQGSSFYLTSGGIELMHQYEAQANHASGH